MIRMNKRMQARAAEETDTLVLLVDPAQLLGLRELVEEARRGNGAAQIREHDLQVLVERVRRREANGHSVGNGTDYGDEPAWIAYGELEAMG